MERLEKSFRGNYSTFKHKRVIVYLKHNEIDKQKWDACIQQSPNGLIYAYSWYLDIACPGWEALVDTNYSSVMPLPCRKRFIINYIYPPFFIQQLGLFSSTKIEVALVQQFLDAIPLPFKFVEYNLNTDNNFRFENFHSKPNLTHHLQLNFEYENLYSHYSQNLKRNLKKVASNHFEIVENADELEIIKIFKANRGAAISKLKEENYGILLHLIKEAKERNATEVIGVKHENKLCAGAVFFRSNNKWIFIFSATNAIAKQNAAMPFLIDYFIQKNANTNSILDFEGSNNVQLARFYKGFGAEEKTYLQLRRNELPKLIHWIKG